MATPELTILSLGWGVQSWTLAAMAALGELPKPDYAIHADTTHERSATYAFAAEMAGWLQQHGLTVVTVSDAAAANPVALPSRGTMIPAYTRNAADHVGQLGRTCTQRWKIAPTRRWLAGELRARGLRKTHGVVEQWFGISWDEFHRMRTPDVRFISHRYPLIERRMTRADCVTWLQAQGLPVPDPSKCTFCPYQTLAMWRETKRRGGADWADAVAVDTAIRDQRPVAGQLFVHAQARPLLEVVRIIEDSGYRQPNLLSEGGAICGSDCWT